MISMPNELLLWQEMGALALSTQSYTMTVLTTQSYTMTVPTIQSHTMICSVCDRKQVCIHWLHNESSYYTILHNESSSVCDRKQVCVHWLHNPSSYTMRVLLFVIENRCVYTDYTITVPTQCEFFCLWRCLHKPMQWELCLVGWHVGLWIQWLMGFGLAPGCDRVKGHFSVPVLWVNSCAHSAVPVLPLYKFTVCTRTSMH